MRVMVDMSVTLFHHGHVRLLKKAKEYGTVVVGLTNDEAVFRKKGYRPELPFSARKEILEAFEYVDEVVETPWLITSSTLEAHNIDALFHGSDNSNDIPEDKLIIVPRTEGISSTDLRIAGTDTLVSMKNKKALFTPGPGSLMTEHLLGLEPCFGRGDDAYLEIEERVLSKLKDMTGHDNIARLQGSASLALEIAVRNFVQGRVLVVTTGYYGDRLTGFCKTAKDLGSISHLDVVSVDEASGASGTYDWLVTVYTETSTGRRHDIEAMKVLADQLGARLTLDATGSIGLEDKHELADVIAYSSCKGLFGPTGAAFIAYNGEPQVDEPSFYLNIATHLNRSMTGPYYTICALDGVLSRHDDVRESVRICKDLFCRRHEERLIHPENEQPLLATLFRGTVKALSDDVVLYQPRSAEPGTSLICHLGECHLGRSAKGKILDLISIQDD